ncbi:hypothetical protein ACH5RR_017863 [Cinchona calisaya]|uniref:Splicing factor 3B subunit 2 n=1 Tax=Cinchona calisaya TaxID=153742 RepID=A0ABD2ZKH5_9GENT
MVAAAQAGFRAIAPNYRGYGLSDPPPEPEKTTYSDFVSNLLAVLDAMCISKIFPVAKDFGLRIASLFVLLHKDRASGIITLGVPFTLRTRPSFTQSLPEGCYVLRWQEPGRAEAEFNRFDAKTVVRKIYILSSKPEIPTAPEGIEIMDLVDQSSPLPSWFTEEDLAMYGSLYEKSGFSTALRVPYSPFQETLLINSFGDPFTSQHRKEKKIQFPQAANENEREKPLQRLRLEKGDNRWRRRKQKKSKAVSQTNIAGDDSDAVEDTNGTTDNDSAKENADPRKFLEQVEVEYVPEKAELDGDLDDEFRKIFEKFSFKDPAGSEENDEKDETAPDAASKKNINSDSEEEEQDPQQKEKGISNKKKKLQRRMKIAELKQISSRPDVVEVWDATSADPKLLVFLKSYRNTVPVPRHWCQKRKFLQGKRGIEKQPFQLPDFIAATGIEKIRQAYIEKEDSKKLKQKQRERMQPKMGKMDIDYQVLHDAFFKYQTKPKLTTHGDLYFEGKEFEVFLVGKDFGAPVAYFFALFHQERVSAIATLGLPFMPPGAPLHHKLLPEGTWKS